MKKLASLLLALVMIVSCIPAMAAMEGELAGGSITIKDAFPGQTYDAYQILYLESYNAATNAYSYKANSSWATWLATQTQYVAIDDQGYVTWVAGASAANFAAAAQQQLAGKTPDGTVTAAGSTEGIDGTTALTTATITGLKLGYYLVDTTLGALCSLDTTNPAVEMEEKNEAPVVKKEVKEGDEWSKTNDTSINKEVEFKASVTVRANNENYIIHDKMSEELTFGSVTAVKIGETDVAAENYTIKTNDLTDGCTFEVEFDNEYIAGLADSTVIEVYYKATLNENAVVADPSTNDVRLQYGDEAHPSYTPWDETKTYTWSMGVLKYANGDETKTLADAQFVLLNADKTEVAKVVNGKIADWTPVAEAKDDNDNYKAEYVLVTDENGEIDVEGLDAGTYYLSEVKAPAGYNKLAEDQEVIVVAGTENNDGTIEYTAVLAKVNNQSGAELPSTGGMGTTILYVGGGILVLAALVMLIVKRRAAAE